MILCFSIFNSERRERDVGKAEITQSRVCTHNATTTTTTTKTFHNKNEAKKKIKRNSLIKFTDEIRDSSIGIACVSVRMNSQQ